MSNVTLRTNVDQYYILASTVFFYYDFALTIPQEVKHIWCSKLNFVNVLIIALRYITVLSFIPVIVLTFAPAIDAGNGNVCHRMGRVPGIIGVICQGFTLVFLIIRLHAIYDKKRWILYLTIPPAVLNAILSSLAIGTAGLMLLPNINGTNGTIISSSCFAEPVLKTKSPSSLLFKLSYVAIILFDTLIFILAVFRMGGIYHNRESRGSRPSLVSILLRDGTILYAVLAISNISSFVLFMLFIDGPDSAIDPNSFDFVVSSGTNSEMTHALSVVFVSRMIFNLREIGTEISEGTTEWQTRIEREEATMRFRVPTITLNYSTDVVNDLSGDEDGAHPTEVDETVQTSV